MNPAGLPYNKDLQSRLNESKERSYGTRDWANSIRVQSTGFNQSSFFGPGAMGTSLGRLPGASGSVPFGGPQEQMFNNIMLANLQVLQQLLALLTAMLMSGGAAGLLVAEFEAGGNQANPVSDASGTAPASGAPSGSSGSSPTGASSAASPVSSAAPTQPGREPHRSISVPGPRC